MGIGFRELILLLVIFGVLAFVVVLVVKMVGAASKPSKASQRTTADRLAELEALKSANQITTAEYEKQRATIVSGI
jgi:uncharacterized membrane protein